MKINDFQYNLTSKFKNAKFFLIRGQGHFFSYLLNRLKWYCYPKLHYVSSFPNHVDIESTNLCNMQCPMCYNRFISIKRGFIDFGLYKKLINECSKLGVFSIRLSLRGEPLLHPRLLDMIKYAKENKIKEVSFLTNGLLLDEKMSKNLINSGLDWITISFDGLGKTYEKIRKPAKFKEALNRVKMFQQIKKELGKQKPVLKIQAIWDAIKDNSEEFYKTFENVADQITVNPTIDYSNNFINHNLNYVCPNSWQRLAITWSGKVFQCGDDLREEIIIGDTNLQSIKEIWNSEKFKKIRYLQKTKQRLKLSPCRKCYCGTKETKQDIEIKKKKSKIDALK